MRGVWRSGFGKEGEEGEEGEREGTKDEEIGASLAGKSARRHRQRHNTGQNNRTHKTGGNRKKDRWATVVFGETRT